jgi:hypothetical protein
LHNSIVCIRTSRNEADITLLGISNMYWQFHYDHFYHLLNLNIFCFNNFSCDKDMSDIDLFLKHLIVNHIYVIIGSVMFLKWQILYDDITWWIMSSQYIWDLMFGYCPAIYVITICMCFILWLPHISVPLTTINIRTDLWEYGFFFLKKCMMHNFLNTQEMLIIVDLSMYDGFKCN